ncbi:MAG: hypothetical protein R2730_00020 [Chitinophagales bacterium]
MFVKKDPVILFPMAITLEVLLLFSIGAYIGGRLNSGILLLLYSCQILLLTFWGAMVLRFVKIRFFQFFWMPIILALLFFNIAMAFRVQPEMVDALMHGNSLFSIDAIP